MAAQRLKSGIAMAHLFTATNFARMVDADVLYSEFAKERNRLVNAILIDIHRNQANPDLKSSGHHAPQIGNGPAMRADATSHSIMNIRVIGVDGDRHVYVVFNETSQQPVGQHSSVGIDFDIFISKRTSLLDQLRKSAMQRRFAADELNRAATQYGSLFK
jgi:hypothetical protein